MEDAFPRVIIEAALHGTPSIGTDRGGIPEAIGNAGVVLSAEASAEEWVEALRAADHHTLGEQARQRATSFTRPCLPDLERLGIYPAANASST
ncbi:glycosyltransferase [Streptomyces cinnabarinus]|uniref:Glycosyltransferase n=1 Tax=Streptomyces cinnabarinus TaxID=67287 RepID=A0ABY7K9U6_9ACTN|nr:glycosyltransferase [Streptomyces cinnabarinus]WAZ21302.1 glycosyltransferase [Streptomyces cinnabarinus]